MHCASRTDALRQQNRRVASRDMTDAGADRKEKPAATAAPAFAAFPCRRNQAPIRPCR